MIELSSLPLSNNYTVQLCHDSLLMMIYYEKTWDIRSILSHFISVIGCSVFLICISSIFPRSINSRAQTLEQTFDGIEFVRITKGSYTFGSPINQVFRLHNEKSQALTISQDFWISKYEISQSEWYTVMGYNPSTFQALGPIQTVPVETISWYQAKSFVAALNQATDDDYYRLPTEVEWEYVAKAGNSSIWSFGDDVQDLLNYAHIGTDRPQSYGTNFPNQWGVYDLYGNIYEWVEDWYQVTRERTLGSCPPPLGTYKVVRGGSYLCHQKWLRSSSRNLVHPTRKTHSIGMRLVRVDHPATDLYQPDQACVYNPEKEQILLHFPPCNNNILPVSSTQIISKNSEGYIPPTPGEQSTFSQMLQALLNNDYESALQFSQTVDYHICHGIEEEEDLLYLKPIHADGSAIVIIRLDPASPLIIGSPHPIYDSTLEGGNLIFESTSAKAYIVSQTHRCANSTPSGCDGITNTCGTSKPYTESDMAHTHLSFFQEAHEVLANFYTTHLFVNLHGMSRDGISLSNGTRFDVDTQAPVARLANALSNYFPTQYITTCNPHDGAIYENHLCGSTNIQGRFLNASGNSCTESATNASNRFIHLEQSSFVKQRPLDVANALSDILPIEP